MSSGGMLPTTGATVGAAETVVGTGTSQTISNSGQDGSIRNNSNDLNGAIDPIDPSGSVNNTHPRNTDEKEITFKTKKNKWSDHNNYYETTIILQNENGPCALIALINTLILIDEINHTDDAKIVKDLISNSSNTVKLREILQVLGELLLNTNQDYDDVDKVLEILPSLHTGLNINPNFLNGGFEDCLEMSIFKAYKVDILHGWCINQIQDDEFDIIKKIQNYENCQNFLVETSSLVLQPINSLSEDEKLQADEHLLIKSWLNKTKTQLTGNGLSRISDRLNSNSFAIFFRNDHFSTIYKGNNNDLYLLMTDDSFQLKNIVWQSLNSISGNDDLFFTGDFTPILNDELNFLLDDFDYSNDAELNDRQLALMLQNQDDEEVAKKLQARYNSFLIKKNSLSKSFRNLKDRKLTSRGSNNITTTNTATDSKKKDRCVIM